MQVLVCGGREDEADEIDGHGDVGMHAGRQGSSRYKSSKTEEGKTLALTFTIVRALITRTNLSNLPISVSTIVVK